jgi:hypothetical protein
MQRIFRHIITIGLVVVMSLLTISVNSQVILPPNQTVQPGAASIIDIIRTNQKLYVRESRGERGTECFTDVNLEEFHKSNMVKKITDDLRNDTTFQAAMQTLRALPPAQRDELLQRAKLTYKPTWAQLGKIDPKGQTEAGQQAEKEIAEAITKLARESL